MSLLFISHSSKDNAVAAEIRDRLFGQGYSTEGSIFLDFDAGAGIQSGQLWEQTLYRNIKASRAVVVLCSEASMASRWCFVEITHARALGKHLFPVKVDGCKIDAVLTDHQVVDLTSDREEGFRRLFGGLAASGLDPASVRNWNPRRHAYPGLLAFQEEDAAVFFGRDREIDEALDVLNRVRRMGDTGLVMVLGGSGSGKSSLVRAGVVPRLRPDTDRWIVVDPFRPGETPNTEFAEALVRAFARYGRPIDRKEVESAVEDSISRLALEAAPATTVERVERTPADAVRRARDLESDLESSDAPEAAVRFARLLRAALEEAPSAANSTGDAKDSLPILELLTDLRRAAGRDRARVLVIIDQFEELLGKHTEARASDFLALLRACAEQPGSPVLFLGTMRSDFMEQFQRHPRLIGMNWEPLSLGMMGTAEIAQVIQKPADVAGIELEAGLTEAILADTETADALPLLAFTMRELEDRYAADRLIQIEEYRDKLGGLQGAVAKAADELVHGLTTDQEAMLRRAFLRLARITDTGSFTKAPVRWDALPEAIHPILERFVQGRLLVSDNKGNGRTLEVSHEALFRSWDRLRGWLTAGAETVRINTDVEKAARAWQEASRSEDYLWHGARLERACELEKAGELDLAPAASEFLSVSKQTAETRRKREVRRLRAVVAVVSALFIVSTVAGVYGWRKQREAAASAADAKKQLEQAEEARLRVQLGNFESQFHQLQAQRTSERDPERRLNLTSELWGINDRADRVTWDLLWRMGAKVGFRGDLARVTQYQMGSRNFEQAVPLAFFYGRGVELSPSMDLSRAKPEELQRKYQDLLTPAQFDEAMALIGKTGAEAQTLWNKSLELKAAALSQHAMTILMGEDLLEHWKKRVKETPKLLEAGVPPSVQTAFLYLTVKEPSKLTLLMPSFESDDWLSLASKLERLYDSTNSKFGPELRQQVSYLAKRVRYEVRPVGAVPQS